MQREVLVLMSFPGDEEDCREDIYNNKIIQLYNKIKKGKKGEKNGLPNVCVFLKLFFCRIYLRFFLRTGSISIHSRGPIFLHCLISF